MNDHEPVTEPPVTPPEPSTEDRPDIERVLKWNEETDGEIPADLSAIPVAEVREYVAQRSSRVAAETEARLRDEFTAEQERLRKQNESRSQAETEIQWAEDLDKRRRSDDAETRARADQEYQSNEDRFINALAARNRVRESAAVVNAVNTYMEPQFTALRESHGEFVTNVIERTKEHGGNLLLAAIEYGKSLGDTEGYSRGKDEAEREFRVEQGAQSPSPAGVGGGVGGSPFAGIDRNRIGAGAAMLRAADRR